MRRIVTTLALLALCAAPAFAASQVRISQVFGGGGGSSPLYDYDYIELYNSGNTAVSIGGWAVEYGSPTGNWGSSASNIVNIPPGVILQPCQYYLIQTGGAGTGTGGDLPVTPDLVQGSGPSIGQASGKIGLFTTPNANVACGAETGLVDKVAFGTSNCAEGTATGLLNNAAGAVRNNGGDADTDDNSVDFTVVGNPVPRNSSSFNPNCLVTPTKSATWGSVKSIYR